MSISLLFLLFPFLPSAWGEIYQWTDKNGNVVFSDTPPSGKEAKIKAAEGGRVYFAPPREERAELLRSEMRLQTPLLPRTGSVRRNGKRRASAMLMSSCIRQTGAATAKAREYITSLGANLTEYNIEEDKSREMRC